MLDPESYLRRLASIVRRSDDVFKFKWSEISIVFAFSDFGRNFGNGGYIYLDGNGWRAVSVPVKDVNNDVLEYVKIVNGVLPRGIVKMLFQYNVQVSKIHAEYDIGNAGRWLVTTDNALEMVEILRPNMTVVV